MKKHLLSPQQALAWQYYSSPKSKTFGNAFKSGIRAGYSKMTARNINEAVWWKRLKTRYSLLDKAEKVLDEILSTERMVDKYGMMDVQAEKLRADVAKFIASTQGKDVGYSTKQEIVGGNEKPITINLISYKDSEEIIDAKLVEDKKLV